MGDALLNIHLQPLDSPIAMHITCNKFEAISSCLTGFMADFVSKKWPFPTTFQNDYPESSGRSPVRQVDASTEGLCVCHGDSE